MLVNGLFGQPILRLLFLSQRLQDDEMGDDPLLEDFKILRRRIFHWHGRVILT